MEIKKWIKKNIKWLILFITMICFLYIAKNIWSDERIKIDIIGHKIISKILNLEYIIPIAKIITTLGSAAFLITISLGITLFVKNKKIVLTIWLNLLIAPLINSFIKMIIQRPRPTEYRLIDEKGYSFPSGHSMVSMAFYGFLIYLIYKYVKNKKLKIISIILLGILIALIGISRIYLGVHYTSDVIGGYLISVSYLIIYIGIVKKLILEK